MAHTKVTQEYNEMKGINTRYRLQYRVKLVPHQRVTQKGFKSTLLLHLSLTSHHWECVCVCVCAIWYNQIYEKQEEEEEEEEEEEQ